MGKKERLARKASEEKSPKAERRRNTLVTKVKRKPKRVVKRKLVVKMKKMRKVKQIKKRDGIRIDR